MISSDIQQKLAVGMAAIKMNQQWSNFYPSI
jgi:hypothetical protein